MSPTAQIMHVMLPSGDPVWVEVGPTATADGAPTGKTQDIGLRDRTHDLIEAGQLAGFAEAVRGVVASVHQALEKCQPTEVTVEFGIAITTRTGAVLSVLADAGGSANIKVSASWSCGNGTPSSPGRGGGDM